MSSALAEGEPSSAARSFIFDSSSSATAPSRPLVAREPPRVPRSRPSAGRATPSTSSRDLAPLRSSRPRLVPTLVCVACVPVLTIALVHWLFGVPISAFRPVLSDEVSYWHEALTFAYTGLRGGYYTLEEVTNPSGFTPFGAHGPGFVMLYGLVAKMFEWHRHSVVVLNLVLIARGGLGVDVVCAAVERTAVVVGAPAWHILAGGVLGPDRNAGVLSSCRRDRHGRAVCERARVAAANVGHRDRQRGPLPALLRPADVDRPHAPVGARHEPITPAGRGSLRPWQRRWPRPP